MKLVLGISRPSKNGDYDFLRTRTIERSYPSVPRQGDIIDVDDDGVNGTSIDTVTWNSDGSVLIELGEVDHLSDGELDAMGFSFEPDDGDDDDCDDDVPSTQFTATPPRELENLASVIEYLSSPTLGEILTELRELPENTPVEITDEDEDMNRDLVYSRYPSGREGEGSEFIDLQAAYLRAMHRRPVDAPRSRCILCGEEITLLKSYWTHEASGQRSCDD